MYGKKLDPSNTLIRFDNFPSQPKKATKKHSALLGIGGNIGDVVRRFAHLYNFLVKSPLVGILETSPILRNPPFGYLEQDDFYNALMAIETDLTPKELLRFVLRVERHFGRKRSFANAPRTLDIDIIFYDDIRVDTDNLTIPHPQYTKRDSVMIPLGLMKGRYRWSKRHL